MIEIISTEKFRPTRDAAPVADGGATTGGVGETEAVMWGVLVVEEVLVAYGLCVSFIECKRHQ